MSWWLQILTSVLASLSFFSYLQRYVPCFAFLYPSLSPPLYLSIVGSSSLRVSISLSSLHPKFGTKTLAESIAEMKKEEQEEDEVDPKLKAYKKQRVLSRQSPYPSLVLEVKAMPPPDFDSSSSSPMQESSSDSTSPDTTAQSELNEMRGHSKDTLNKLEALFSKASTDHTSTEGRSEDSISEVRASSF